ncbi:MAG: hypothetical protein ACRDAM_08425 [Casimicrobium sp.]
MKRFTPLEQIEALLRGRASELVRDAFEDALDSQSITDTHFLRCFSVTRSDVFNHVLMHGFPEGSVTTRPHSYDGEYLLEERGGFSVFTQERGIRFDETHHDNRSDAVTQMTKLLLMRGGTWTRLRR